MSLEGNKTVRRSDSMKKQPLGATRLINLITSIKTQSEENSPFSGILKNQEQPSKLEIEKLLKQVSRIFEHSSYKRRCERGIGIEFGTK
jgi:hypothetical protein